MHLDWKKITWGGGILGVVLLIALLLRFLFGGSVPEGTPSLGSFPAGESNAPAQQTVSSSEAPPLILSGSTGNAPAVFKIADGPIAGAVFIQTSRPTTTVARYVNAGNGHVYDLAVDSPGAVPQTISNSTIPGILRALWRDDGRGVLLQFMPSTLSSTIRTVSLQFVATTSRSATVRFLPDNLLDIAVSPEGTSVAYLKAEGDGAAAYAAQFDGASERKLFSFPLSGIALSWPSSLVFYTKSAVGVPGAVFSANASSGSFTERISAPGITGTESSAYLLYQTNAGAGASSYARNLTEGTDRRLSFDPIPEKCLWESVSSVYCAVPLSALPANYLDLWHLGAASANDFILRFNLATGAATIIAAPASTLGAETPDIVELGISPDGRYLLFITKSSQTLWGVRLK